MVASRVYRQAIIITADQIVLYEGTVREKPEDKQQAHDYLSSYSHKSAQVPHDAFCSQQTFDIVPPYGLQTVSAMVVHNTTNNKTADGTHIASVKFNAISEATIENAIATGTVFSSAGGFCVKVCAHPLITLTYTDPMETPFAAIVSQDPDLAPCIKEIQGGLDSVYGLPVPTLVRVCLNIKVKNPGDMLDCPSSHAVSQMNLIKQVGVEYSVLDSYVETDLDVSSSSSAVPAKAESKAAFGGAQGSLATPKAAKK